MSRGPENTFIGSVHKHLPAKLYRMKNHNEFNSGIADCWYSGARDLWVEYKWMTVPERADTPIHLCLGKNPLLSPLQQQWLRERRAEGRNVAVIVGCKAGGVVFVDGGWTHSITAGEFRALILTRQEIANWITEQTSWTKTLLNASAT